MSTTGIYGFDKEGNAYLQDETRNSWRGGMAIWNLIEERYLPAYRPSYVPSSIPDDKIETWCHYKPIRMADMGNENAAHEIWDLADNPKLTDSERIVLFTTFDKCLVKKEDIPMIINAFKEFGGETSLPEQAEILAKMYADDSCIAVGWSQISVCSENWSNYNYDEMSGEKTSYNCLTQTDHRLCPRGKCFLENAAKFQM
jgi:hypothetical protein